MDNTEIMYTCDLCSSSYQMGRHKYDGKYIPSYKLNVCKMCYEGNWDGWSKHDEQTILLHLKENNLQIPERNENKRLANSQIKPLTRPSTIATAWLDSLKRASRTAAGYVGVRILKYGS